jgi:glucan phosphoethanolaminetransferase (alkaline phosphatase superfamily)
MRAYFRRKNSRHYRLLQLLMVSPLVLMWVGFFEFYRTRSVELLRTLFPADWWSAVLLVGLPLAAFLFTLYRMFRRSPDKFDWMLDILLCLFVGCSMFILIGQVLSL